MKMQNNHEPAKFSLRENIAPLSVFAASVVISVLGILLLPEMIYVQIFSEAPNPETGTVFFLTAAALVVGLSGLMSIITDNRKKWLALESVLAILQLGCVVYNFVVL